MPAPLPASLLDRILAVALGSPAPPHGNRFSLEGLAVATTPDGAVEIRAAQLAATSLRLASGPFTLEAAQLSLSGLVAKVRKAEGGARLEALSAASAELSGVKIHGPVSLPEQAISQAAPAGAWNLAPLATADGNLQAEIVDAHLVFDAHVTVPLRHGQVEFRDATVEHVGPDSRMGASRMGIYVDAPNGRSYLYQFSTSPVPGVEYEKRGAMLGPWVTDRGRLQLQEFGEWLLRQPWAGQARCLTEQARLLFDRTAVTGDVQLGDGRFAAPGVQAELAGRAQGRNSVRLHSQAVGRGVTLEIASLLVRAALLHAGARQIACDEVTGALTLNVSSDNDSLRFAFELKTIRLAGLRLQPAA